MGQYTRITATVERYGFGQNLLTDMVVCLQPGFPLRGMIAQLMLCKRRDHAGCQSIDERR